MCVECVRACARVRARVGEGGGAGAPGRRGDGPPQAYRVRGITLCREAYTTYVDALMPMDTPNITPCALPRTCRARATDMTDQTRGTLLTRC